MHVDALTAAGSVWGYAPLGPGSRRVVARGTMPSTVHAVGAGDMDGVCSAQRRRRRCPRCPRCLRSCQGECGEHRRARINGNGDGDGCRRLDRVSLVVDAIVQNAPRRKRRRLGKRAIVVYRQIPEQRRRLSAEGEVEPCQQQQPATTQRSGSLRSPAPPVAACMATCRCVAAFRPSRTLGQCWRNRFATASCASPVMPLRSGIRLFLGRLA